MKLMVSTEETVQQFRSRLRDEYFELFRDAPPILMLGGTERQKWDTVECAIKAGKAIEVEIPLGTLS